MKDLSPLLRSFLYIISGDIAIEVGIELLNSEEEDITDEGITENIKDRLQEKNPPGEAGFIVRDPSSINIQCSVARSRPDGAKNYPPASFQPSVSLRPAWLCAAAPDGR